MPPHYSGFSTCSYQLSPLREPSIAEVMTSWCSLFLHSYIKPTLLLKISFHMHLPYYAPPFPNSWMANFTLSHSLESFKTLIPWTSSAFILSNLLTFFPDWKPKTGLLSDGIKLHGNCDNFEQQEFHFHLKLYEESHGPFLKWWHISNIAKYRK